MVRELEDAGSEVVAVVGDVTDSRALQRRQMLGRGLPSCDDPVDRLARVGDAGDGVQELAHCHGGG